MKMGGIETPTPVPRNLDHMLVRASPSLNSALDAESVHMTNKLQHKTLGDGEGTLNRYSGIASGIRENSHRPSEIGEYQNVTPLYPSNFAFQEDTTKQEN